MLIILIYGRPDLYMGYGSEQPTGCSQHYMMNIRHVTI